MSGRSPVLARACRTALAWSAVALFTATAFFGQGLHFIPGLQHACHGPDCDDGHGSAAVCCQHGHEDDTECHAGASGSAISPAASHDHDCSTCPICLFLATSKAPTAEAPPVIQPVASPAQATYSLPCLVSLSERPLGPRGPPAA